MPDVHAHTHTRARSFMHKSYLFPGNNSVSQQVRSTKSMASVSTYFKGWMWKDLSVHLPDLSPVKPKVQKVWGCTQKLHNCLKTASSGYRQGTSAHAHQTDTAPHPQVLSLHGLCPHLEIRTPRHQVILRDSSVCVYSLDSCCRIVRMCRWHDVQCGTCSV